MKKSSKSTKLTLRCALPPADPYLAKPEVVAKLSLTHVTSSIEQVGDGYESLKKRFEGLEERKLMARQLTSQTVMMTHSPQRLKVKFLQPSKMVPTNERQLRRYSARKVIFTAC